MICHFFNLSMLMRVDSCMHMFDAQIYYTVESYVHYLLYIPVPTCVTFYSYI